MRFETVRFGEYFKLQKGISYTSNNLVEESETGLLTINAFTAGGGYKANSEKAFSGDLKGEFVLSDGDVLVAMTEQDEGLLASPLVVKIDETPYQSLTFSLDVARVHALSDDFDPRFIFNVLRIPAFRKRAAYGDTGSTVQRLPYEALGDLRVPKPPLTVQLRVIELMDCLDAKIRNNVLVSQLLEDIAAAVFKSWFVDFDPVKARGVGELLPGFSAELSQGFPSSFMGSEVGEIPAGWRLGQISDLGRIVTGKTPSTKKPEFWGNDVPFVTIPDLHVSTVVTKTARKLSTLGAVSQKNQALPAGSTVVSCIATAGLVGYLSVASQTNQQINSIVPNNMAHREWIFFKMLSLRPLLKNESSIGTVFANLNKSGFSSIGILIPDDHLIEAFSALVRPLVEETLRLSSQSESLRNLRDELLPGLVSGTISFNEAEGSL
jgi:type I restriction enzyme S subunit